MALFTLKYAPQNSKEIIGQSLAVPQLKDFLLNYKKQKHKAALIYGPIGIGKTSSVYALAKELKYDLLEINSSDIRNEANIKGFLSSALGQQSLFFVPKLVLIDEIDNISGTHDRGCIPALLNAIEKSCFPVILTANDPSDSKFNDLRKHSLQIEYQPLDYKLIAAFLKDICFKEKIKAEEKDLNNLARRVDGDLRAALIDLQTADNNPQDLSKDVPREFHFSEDLSDRKRTETIFNALRLIFKSSHIETALPALDNLDLEPNEIFLWLDENLPKEYNSPTALAKAYEYLSRADIFQKRISRWQYWRFLVYINNFLTAGISSAKEEKNPNFIEYSRTTRILKIWQAKIKFAKKKEIASKLALATHTSHKVALHQMPYFQQIFKKSTNNIHLVKEINLNEEEVEWLKK